LEPEDFGIDEPRETPVGGSVEACCTAFVDILGGKYSAASDVVALNAAVVLYVAGAEPNLPAAFERAGLLLAGGEPWRTFVKAREIARGG
jgi:anthranilate phosphoribosyltransferase